MVLNMSSDIDHVSPRDEKSLMEDEHPGAHVTVVQDNRRTDDSPQFESTNNLDDSEPEVTSESDGDEDIFFKPSPSLPSPNVIKRTLRELNDLMNTPYLHLDSPEHRPRLYEGADALTGIIDSLSQNYEFPPIFFNQKQVRGPDGSIQYNRVCIDGLKRLSAIKAFMDGDIPCHDYRRRKWFFRSKSQNSPESNVAGERRFLPNDCKEIFQNKHFVCHEFEDLTGMEEIELRARVHVGSTLAPGERLRASILSSGDLMINFAKTLESDFQQIAGLADTSRMRGFQNLMKCSSQILEVQRARAEDRAPLLRISDTALNDFIKLADVLALEKIKETLGVFGIMVERHPELFKRKSGVPFRPMEMIIIAVLTFKYYQTKVKPWMFIRLIDSVRESIHNFSRHQGVLQTRQNWTNAWDLIQNFEKFIAEGEDSNLGHEVDRVTQTEKRDESAMPSEVAAVDLEQRIGSRASSATAHSLHGVRVGESPLTFPQHSMTVKRKASPHHLNPAKKRVQLPAPVSPAMLQSPRASLRADSPDSVLGSDGSGDEQGAETTLTVIQQEQPAQSASPVPIPRQLVRSSFKSNSEFVPRRSESPKPNGSALNTLIASVPVPPSPSNAVSSSPSGLNILFGASQRPAIKPSLLYSHETKKNVPYQSSGTLPSVEPSSKPGSRHVTPVNQSHIKGYETPTMPPYSGRGRPRKYPPKPATPEGQTSRKRGRPRKDSNLPVPDPPRVQAYGIRGRGRGRKSVPGGSSTRVAPTSQPFAKLDTHSPILQQNGVAENFADQSAPVYQWVPPVFSPPRASARLSGRPRKDVIPSSTPSAESPPPDLQSTPGINQDDKEPPPKTVASYPVDPKVVDLDPAQQCGQPDDMTIPIPELSSVACHDKPAEVQSSTAPAEPSQVPAPPVPPALTALQSRAVSISSSREARVSRLSTMESLSTMSPRSTSDPTLIDAKPSVAPFKAGGASAIRERRRREQAELEEKKRRKQEAEKLANSATGSGASNF